LLLFFENETEINNKALGRNEELKTLPKFVVIDGQQRLTSLYAVFTGHSVIKEGGKKEQIRLSFNPVTTEFNVADASTEKGHDWIYDIKEILNGENLYHTTTEYLSKYKERNPNTNPEKEKLIADNIQRLCDIGKIEFTVLQISKHVSIEEVSEIFLRINSRGRTLNNSDFILTLMSVYWEEGRKMIEDFSNWTKEKNDIADLNADDVMRVLVGVGFKRAKLEDIYNLLRGQTHQFSTLHPMIEQVSNHQNWRNFLTIIKDAGFISKDLISQKILLLACYIFYLIGLEEYKMSFQELNSIIRLYYVAMFISQKYSKSASESTLSKDLQTLEKIENKDQFLKFLQDEISLFVSPELWNMRLPRDMITSSTRSPLFIAFIAAQIYFQHHILFRNIPLSKYFIDMKDKIHSGEKSEMDLHHIFPRNYLISLYGRDSIEDREINQIANKVYTYNSDNRTISNQAPSEYIQQFSNQGHIDWNKNLEQNAIPSNFGELNYEDFLQERRVLMLQIIKNYFNHLKDPHTSITPLPIKDQIAIGENNTTEFKSSYRRDVRQQQLNDSLKFQIIKTIAAFLNSEGGKLYVGVADDGTIPGIENDINAFPKGLDGLLLDIDNLTKTHFSTAYALIKAKVENIENKQILIFDVKASKQPVYFTYQGKEEFYIRKTAGSLSLTIGEANNYIRDHF
ncbi:MAG: putative DNA binding domain-containing protein, partial [candidate division SR1 bacterium]|nr:putative DNA binding domain-containing protein [candidate division SR1 bacterium]